MSALASSATHRGRHGKGPEAASGEARFLTPGTYTWTVPAGVTTISAVLIGAGGAGENAGDGYGGGGGALGYINNRTVSAGQTLTIVVPAGQTTRSIGTGADADNASILGQGISAVAQGGRDAWNPLAGADGYTVAATYSGCDGGGNGGKGYHKSGRRAGGAGAGGYSGAGGNCGVAYGATYYAGAADGTMGGSGGGGGGGIGGNTEAYGGGGGGVGIYGEGASGAGGAIGADSNIAGRGGSGGANGSEAFYDGANVEILNGGAFGGGGCGARSALPVAGSSCNGGQGAVRIIWGTNRIFPSTNVSAASSSTIVTY